YVWEQPLFEQAGGRPVCFQVGRIDHQLVGLAALRREGREDPVENAEPAPADEAIVDRLRWTILGRRIAPSQAVPDDENDAAYNPTVIHPWYAVRQREIRLDPAHLRLRKPDQITHDNASSTSPLNQLAASPASNLIGPEPSPFALGKILRLALCFPCRGQKIRLAARLLVTARKFGDRGVE